MSKQNKWKRIKPTKGQTYTISDDDYKKLGDMLPNKQSDTIDDLTDLSTFIYYTLVNLMNKADVTNDANELRRDIYNAYYAISQKLPTDGEPEAMPEDLKEGDHITDANDTEHVVLGHSAGNLILETMDGKRSEVPYPVIEKELAGGTAHISSTNTTIPKDEDLLETDDWKQSPYYSKATQQINGWHSDADVRNLARQLRDTDKKPTDKDDHFGEEQAEGLDSLLEGLRDTPHDNRW